MKPDPTLYLRVLAELEANEIPYVIIGAVAALTYGVTRATHDIDMIVSMNNHHITALAAAFPLPRYYADPYQMQQAMEKGSNFNIIDVELGQKADLFALGMDRRYDAAFEHRVRRRLHLVGSEPLHVWVARVEDVIYGKLMAWAEGRSQRHLADIYEMLVFHYLQSESSRSPLDEGYVDERAHSLGDEVSAQWQLLKESAREFAGRQGS